MYRQFFLTVIAEHCQNRGKIFGIVAIISIFSCLWWTFFTARSVSKNHENGFTSFDKSVQKKVLIWTNFFGGREVWKHIFKRIITGKCEESRCIISFDRESIETADAVLFNAYDVALHEKMPEGLPLAGLPTAERKPHQIYIFYSMESPRRMNRSKFKKLGGYFNWTMTYRKDSDVVEPFGTVTKRTTPRRRNEIHFVTQKELEEKKMVVWMASHCSKTAFRHSYIQGLKRYLHIETFGECGKVCDNGMMFGIYGKDVGFSECERNISNFAFYLAFENSFCDDYVTEKIYKAWTLGTIPIVMGGVNYSSLFPPKSIIDIRDFGTTSELADYLKKVASDINLYNEYLEWKMYYDFEVGSPYNALTCDLCKKLHSHDLHKTKQSYDDIEDWFFNKSNCKNGY